MKITKPAERGWEPAETRPTEYRCEIQNMTHLELKLMFDLLAKYTVGDPNQSTSKQLRKASGYKALSEFVSYLFKKWNTMPDRNPTLRAPRFHVVVNQYIDEDPTSDK